MVQLNGRILTTTKNRSGLRKPIVISKKPRSLSWKPILDMSTCLIPKRLLKLSRLLRNLSERNLVQPRHLSSSNKSSSKTPSPRVRKALLSPRNSGNNSMPRSVSRMRIWLTKLKSSRKGGGPSPRTLSVSKSQTVLTTTSLL